VFEQKEKSTSADSVDALLLYTGILTINRINFPSELYTPIYTRAKLSYIIVCATESMVSLAFPSYSAVCALDRLY
jgi:hypothetical protein